MKKALKDLEFLEFLKNSGCDYTKLEKLGKGGRGTAYYFFDENSGIKKVLKETLSEDEHEFAIIQKQDCFPNFAQIYGTAKNAKYYYIIQEYINLVGKFDIPNIYERLSDAIYYGFKIYDEMEYHEVDFSIIKKAAQTCYFPDIDNMEFLFNYIIILAKRMTEIGADDLSSNNLGWSEDGNTIKAFDIDRIFNFEQLKI